MQEVVPNSGTGTVDKALDVLFHLHEVGPAGVSEVARALGLPKSSAHRLLSTLARRGLLERDAAGRYRPGFALVALGLGALGREPVVAAARPVLEREAAAVGETFFLVGARAGALVVLDEVEGTGVLRVAPRVGSRVPLHATAAGHLYLAFAPERVESSETPREAYTPCTLVRDDALASAVAAARTRGWAVNRGQWIDGLSVLTAAIDPEGSMPAVVAMAAASPRFEALGGEALAPRLLDAAATIARRLRGAET